MTAKFDIFFRAIVSRYTRACKAVFQRENRSARKPLTKRLNFNRNNGLILMEQKCSFFRTRIYHWPQTFILMVYKITRSVLYSITSEQTRRFIDWKIRREREKFFDRDSLREIYLGGKLENVTREEENCTGVKYYIQEFWQEQQSNLRARVCSSVKWLILLQSYPFRNPP